MVYNENPMEMDDLVVPHFRTSPFGSKSHLSGSDMTSMTQNLPRFIACVPFKILPFQVVLSFLAKKVIGAFSLPGIPPNNPDYSRPIAFGLNPFTTRQNGFNPQK